MLESGGQHCGVRILSMRLTMENRCKRLVRWKYMAIVELLLGGAEGA